MITNTYSILIISTYLCIYIIIQGLGAERLFFKSPPRHAEVYPANDLYTNKVILSYQRANSDNSYNHQSSMTDSAEDKLGSYFVAGFMVCILYIMHNIYNIYLLYKPCLMYYTIIVIIGI